MIEDSAQGKSFTRGQRFQLRIIQYVGFCLVGVGRTVRWKCSGDEHLQEAYAKGKRVIFAFWHNRIILSTWYWRNRGIMAMTSMNYDGEYIARIVEMYGYSAARGSSSHGGLRALLQMSRCLTAGRDVAFTVDGPRGPRYEAKPGPLILAKRTGCPILCFNISSSRCLQLNSWDHFQIPAPFSRAQVLMAPLIWVPPDASQEALRDKQNEMQAALDRLTEEGDSGMRNVNP
jgi:lysophospholipid acyltransferase (LPLAT)-like uncharacterized protein